MNMKQMIDSHPNKQENSQELADCIEKIGHCAAICTLCADACLGEQEHLQHLVRCIRLNLDCADICAATASVLTRCGRPDLDLVESQVRACAEACRACAGECELHGPSMEHCRICAQACWECAKACEAMLGASTGIQI